MIANHIKVIYEDTNSNSIDGADVTPEQAEGIKVANEIHNMFSAYNFEWYGNSYYDFETGSIKVGITDFSTDNQNTVKELVGEIEVDMFQCEYSYEYLEEIYNKMDNRRSFLKLLGVEGYYISVIDNCVTVRISDADNYIAIYAVNELTNGKGGVVFKTTSYIADLQP